MVQYAAACRAQLKSYSCSETPQDESGLTTPQNEPLTKMCNDLVARMESRVKPHSLNDHRLIESKRPER